MTKKYFISGISLVILAVQTSVVRGQENILFRSVYQAKAFGFDLFLFCLKLNP